SFHSIRSCPGIPFGGILPAFSSFSTVISSSAISAALALRSACRLTASWRIFSNGSLEGGAPFSLLLDNDGFGLELITLIAGLDGSPLLFCCTVSWPSETSAKGRCTSELHVE